MDLPKSLPEIPCLKIHKHDEQIIPEDGFLKIARIQAEFEYPDGSRSDKITMDSVIRRGQDAVVLLAHYQDFLHRPWIYLRSAIRPAVSLYDYSSTGVLEEPNAGNLWELPAGLIEKEETGLHGIRSAGARELREELGFVCEPNQLNFLGQRIFGAAGLCSERLFFLELEVIPAQRKEPEEDGGPFEKGGVVAPILLTNALAYVHTGLLSDSKTEIGIRRIVEFYSKRGITI